MFGCIAEDVIAGQPKRDIAARFHGSLAAAIAAACDAIRGETGVSVVALSGGTFQNELLLESITVRLTTLEFTVYRHRRVPPNDGGLSLGQAVLAAHATQRGQ